MLPNPASFATYGGEKQDYAPVEDPTTDRAAAETNEALADTAAMTRMAARAVVVFTVSGSVCTVVDHDSLWGKALAVKPTITRNAAGDYTIAWPTTVTDERGATRTLNLRFGLGQVAATGWIAAVLSATANAAQVTTRNTIAGATTDPSAAITVIVW